MDPSALSATQITYFSLLTHTKQLLFVTFFDMTAGIGASFRTHRHMADGCMHGGEKKMIKKVFYFAKITLP